MVFFGYQILFPRWQKETKKFVWPGLQVKRTKQYNRGVYATQFLPSGTLIPYLGRVLTRKQVEKERPCFEYLFREKSDTYLDGNPAYDQYNLFITSLINEPDFRQHSNMTMIYQRGDSPGSFLMVIQDISPGEQLTWHYGDLYLRKRYKVGRSGKIPPHLPHYYLTLKEKDNIKYQKLRQLTQFR